jgi:hypothetical protein
MRRWVFFAVAVPVAAWALDRVADQIAARRGEGHVTRVLRMPRAHRLARRAR